MTKKIETTKTPKKHSKEYSVGNNTQAFTNLKPYLEKGYSLYGAVLKHNEAEENVGNKIAFTTILHHIERTPELKKEYDFYKNRQPLVESARAMLGELISKGNVKAVIGALKGYDKHYTERTESKNLTLDMTKLEQIKENRDGRIDEIFND